LDAVFSVSPRAKISPLGSKPRASEISSNLAIAIQTTNPFQHRVDLLWYEVPVVCELSQQRLHYYDKASNFWENFRGEVVWQPLRTVIQQVLMPQ
jgi:hypothetical protein